MDKFKKYNAQTKDELEKSNHAEIISYDTYGELCDKTYNVMSYLLNLLGDSQTTSISYFKYRQQLQKRINRGSVDIPLATISPEVSELLSEFNKMRNWQNHVPESLLIAEMDMVQDGTMEFPMNPVEITHYRFVTYEYFEHLYLSNIEFCENARKVIQAAKRDYSLLMGERIVYPRVYSDIPLGLRKSKPTHASAKVQGLHVKNDIEN